MVRTRKDCTQNFGCNIHKVSDSPRIPLDMTQSEKQKPACAQQLTLFLRGYDSSRGCSPATSTQNPLLPSLLLLSPASRQPPRDSRSGSPSVSHCHRAGLLQIHFQESDPRLNLDGDSTSRKERWQRMHGHLPEKLLCTQPPANGLCGYSATLHPASHAPSPARGERAAQGLQTRLEELFLVAG